MNFIHKHKTLLSTILLSLFLWVSFVAAQNLHKHAGSQGVFWHSHPLANGDNPTDQNHNHSDYAVCSVSLSFGEAILPSCIEVPSPQVSLYFLRSDSYSRDVRSSIITNFSPRGPPVAA